MPVGVSEPIAESGSTLGVAGCRLLARDQEPFGPDRIAAWVLCVKPASFPRSVSHFSSGPGSPRGFRCDRMPFDVCGVDLIRTVLLEFRFDVRAIRASRKPRRWGEQQAKNHALTTVWRPGCFDTPSGRGLPTGI